MFLYCCFNLLGIWILIGGVVAVAATIRLMTILISSSLLRCEFFLIVCCKGVIEVVLSVGEMINMVLCCDV